MRDARQLTFEGRRAGEGYFSGDGRQLVFQSERDPENPFFQIFLMDLESGDVSRVSPGHGKTTCSWMMPGGDVIYASTHDDPQARDKQKQELEDRLAGRQKRYAWDYDPAFDVYRHDRGAGSDRNLTNTLGYDAECAASPDGTRICFASNRHAYSGELSADDRAKLELDPSYFMEIYVMDADGGNVRRLTDAPGYDGGPFFSADGQRICWRRFSTDGATAEVFTMSADGSDVRQLTRLGAMSWAPYFHPSGEYLIFTTNLHGFDNFELYLVDALGQREPVRVTETPGFDGLPAFSPDGQRLAWTTSRGGGKQGQLFIAGWNHDAALRRLRQAGAAVSPAPADASGTGADAPAFTADILAAELRTHVTALCTEAMDGRLTGTAGERLAGEYIAQQFARIGLRPAGDNGTYFQEFAFTAGAALGESNALTADRSGGASTSWKVDQNWRPLAFSQTGDIPAAGVVFAGYGIVAPAADGQPEYDSFVHLDVSGKWVLLLRFLPEDVSAERRQHLNRFASLRYKAMMLRDRGAAGMIVASGTKSGVKDPLVRFTFDAAIAGTSLAAVSVTDEVADQLLAASGKTLAELQAELDKGEGFAGFAIPETRLSASIQIEKVQRTGRNVLGVLDSGHPDAAAVVLGAHYDHLGRGEGTNSLARDEEKGGVHVGADDNASGVSGMLEIAEELASRKARGDLAAKRDVVFAAWSGEELGLLGSQHFVDALAKRVGGSTLSGAVAAYLNMDMIGRLTDKLVLSGVGSSASWPAEIERRNAPIGVPLSLQNDSYLPTDSTAFYLKGVPILSAFTGSHEDYHSPRDTPEKLNYEGAEKTARLMALLARSLATSAETPEYVEMAKPENLGQRAGLRAYLGSIPDYAEGEAKGLKLSGVAKGGPAEQGGLRAGDVIVELAGRTIENIYDYTYAIDALKIGEPVAVVVMRDGQRVELSITPSSRE